MSKSKTISASYKGALRLEAYAYKKKRKMSIFGSFVKRFFMLDLNDYTLSYSSKRSSKKILFQVSLLQIHKVGGECGSTGPWPFGISISTDKRLFELYFQNSVEYNLWICALCAADCIAIKPDLKATAI
jgi:Meiotic cell cortex C-terminal pleckstrin homology